MTLQMKIYIGVVVATIFTIGILGGSAWSDRKIAKLEKKVEQSKQAAGSIQQTAVSKEIEAAGYKKKIEYLETQIGEIQKLARKQDEELEKRNFNSRRARSDAKRANSTRTITATAGELCQKLAELGHPCG